MKLFEFLVYGEKITVFERNFEKNAVSVFESILFVKINFELKYCILLEQIG